MTNMAHEPAPRIPLHWSSRQALAVFECVDALREQIWALYRDAIQHALRDELSVKTDPRQFSLDLYTDDDL